MWRLAPKESLLFVFILFQFYTVYHVNFLETFINFVIQHVPIIELNLIYIRLVKASSSCFEELEVLDMGKSRKEQQHNV